MCQPVNGCYSQKKRLIIFIGRGNYIRNQREAVLQADVEIIFIYPFYTLILTLLAFFLKGSWYSFLLLLVLPFTAWSHVQLKKQIDK